MSHNKCVRIVPNQFCIMFGFTMILFGLLAISEGAQLLAAPLGLESCVGRCDDNLDPDAPCQCNVHCKRFGDCCDDYEKACEGDSVDRPTDTELKQLTEELWSMDDNRLPESHIEVDPQSSGRFITYVDESYFSKPTFAAMIKLMDNYVAKIGEPDLSPCAPCLQEQEAFLNAILDTRLMLRVWVFLSAKGYVSSNETEFKRQLSQYWFQPYSRSGGTLDSSGFEHVFVGQLSTKVSGFHNWVQFYTQEEEEQLDYKSYIQGCEPSLHMLRFDWENKYKSYGSLFVGTSPEFEMAVYTLCFLTRQSGACSISLNSKSRSITTYTMSGVTPVTVGTAYPDC